MNTGLRPTPIDPKDKHFSFNRLFGTVQSFPLEYNAEESKIVPDQNSDGRGTACTAYTVCEIGTDQDGIQYSHDYQYMKTLEVMNKPPETQGADLRTAFKVACTFGLLPATYQDKKMLNDTQAWSANQANWDLKLDKMTVIKPAYLTIYPSGDWFDGIRNALIQGQEENRTIGIGTPWYTEWLDIGSDGILAMPKRIYSWHAYKIVGWKKIGDETYLICKPWQGKRYGDKGYVYLSREACNRAMSTWGSYGATLQDIPTGTIDELRRRKITFLEVITALTQNLLMRIKYGFI